MNWWYVIDRLHKCRFLHRFGTWATVFSWWLMVHSIFYCIGWFYGRERRMETYFQTILTQYEHLDPCVQQRFLALVIVHWFDLRVILTNRIDENIILSKKYTVFITSWSTLCGWGLRMNENAVHCSSQHSKLFENIGDGVAANCLLFVCSLGMA